MNGEISKCFTIDGRIKLTSQQHFCIAENNLPTYIKYLPIVNSIMKTQASKIIQNRMSQRLWVIGSNEVTENQIL